MTSHVTVQDLFDQFHEKLGLEWASGGGGKKRLVRAPHPDSVSASLVGHLNIIHPHRVQVLGKCEKEYLQHLRKNSRDDTLGKLFCGESDAIIVAESQEPPAFMAERADAENICLITSTAPSRQVVNTLFHFFNTTFSRKTTLHGVFMEVMGIGVLITGDPSIGKSELALELLTRGHRLIADDAPEFSPAGPDLLGGTCPELLKDFLEVRGLGVLNVREMFGDSAVKNTKYLRLVIYLESMSDSQLLEIDRLQGSHHMRTIQGIDVPEITLPVAPGRNLAVMVEAAARNHILRTNGYDASEDFVRRHQTQIDSSKK